MKRVCLLLILFMLVSIRIMAQDEAQYRTVDTTFVFSESDFTVQTHWTGYLEVYQSDDDRKNWGSPNNIERANVTWRRLKFYVARDETLVDISCETEDETLLLENAQIKVRQTNSDYLKEDFPVNRVYNSTGVGSERNAENTGFLYFYEVYVSPFRYDSQECNFYLYKTIHLKIRFQKNPPTIVTVRGTVKDQDGQPIPEANLEFAGTKYDVDNSGAFQMVFSLPTYTDYSSSWVSGRLEAKADGCTSFEAAYSFDGFWNTLGETIDIMLYNKLHFNAGRHYTLILPESPEASLGRYFRLDRVEENKIIFERESSPQANIPYVFFPDNDVTISLEGLDLTQEPGCTIVNVNDRTDIDPRLFFEGSYITGSHSRYYLGGIYSRMKIEENDYYQDENSRYVLNAMHATMYVDWNLFGNSAEFVFHDPNGEDAINDIENELVHYTSVNHQYYDLSGRRLSTPPLVVVSISRMDERWW